MKHEPAHNPASEAGDPIAELVTKRTVAEAANVSIRTIDTWQRQKRIPCVKLSPRCVRYHLPSVLKALQRFTVEAAA